MMKIIISVFVIGFSTVALAEEAIYMSPESGEYKVGRDIWLGTCVSCHGYGVADAPMPMRPDDWRSRVNKDRQTLYTHAIEGFLGADYSMMPARGGNAALSDSEIRSAVEYMLYLANYFIEQDKRFIQQQKGEL